MTSKQPIIEGVYTSRYSFSISSYIASNCLTLKEVENELKDVTDYVSLGIQLGIESFKLRLIERNYPTVERRKIEVIDHWLHNADDVSWTSLAKAIEDMGGQDRLAQHLRMKGKVSVSLYLGRGGSQSTW